MGFQDALYKQHLAYGSERRSSLPIAPWKRSATTLSRPPASWRRARAPTPATRAHCGARASSRMDSLDKLIAERGEQYIEVDRARPWIGSPCAKVQSQGMRNSNVMAIAPTATIANITGVSQSIEPTYQNLYVKSNLSGEFTVVNPYLVRDLKASGLWDRSWSTTSNTTTAACRRSTDSGRPESHLLYTLSR